MSKPKRDGIFLSGYFGFGNLGDEAILEAVVTELKRRHPSVRLIASSGNPTETVGRYGIDAVDFFASEQVGDAIAHCRLVLFGMGGVFQDYWGAYAANLFKAQTNGIEAYARPALFAALHGVPAVLFCGGIGPLRSREGKALFALACRFADTVIARDEASADEVRDAGFDVPALVAADPGCLLASSAGDVERVAAGLARQGLSQASLAVFSLRPWSFQASEDALIEAAAQAVAGLPEGWRAVFVPFARGGSGDDTGLAVKAAAACHGRGHVLEVSTPGEAIALARRAQIAVGMRLHSVILAACAGTPAVPIVYDPKVASAAQALGVGEFAVPVGDPSGLAAAVERAIYAAERTRAAMPRALDSWRQAALSAFDVVDGILEEAPAGRAGARGPAAAGLSRLLEECAAATETLRRSLRAQARRRAAALGPAAAPEPARADAESDADAQIRLRALSEAIRAVEASSARSRERSLRAVQRLRREIAEARHEADALRQELSVRKSEWEEKLRVERNEHRQEKTELGRAISDVTHELAQVHHSRLWKTGLAYWALRRRALAAADAVTAPARRLGKVLSRQAPPERASASDASSETSGADAPPSPCPIAAANRHDVLCFPIIDWDFRFQRPQQLMARFGRAGHRVFYVAQQFRQQGPPWEVRRKAENVWEVSLRGPARNVYKDLLDGDALDELWLSLDALRRDLSLDATASVVELPFWWPLASRARAQWLWPVIYDCMDHHAGFTTNEPAMLRQEEDLLSSSDLVLASSAFLEKEARARNANVAVIRNACDYEHFAGPGVKRRRGRRPVVGYYGAISDWFDADLVADLAARRPDWDFLLVGSTFGADLSRLEKLPNVKLPGEKPYAEIPSWLARFDVAFIPFKRIPLTEATNPVKAYEMFAAGKPLVAVPLPEILPMAPHARLASTAADFEREIGEALDERGNEKPSARRAFARENTWEKRFEVLQPAVARTFPRVSVVIVTYNNLALNRLCLDSVFGRTEWPNVEVFAVDNASTDGTPDFLTGAEKKYSNLRVILNQKNWGFAVANNQGLKESTGQYRIMLNNDTVVSRGWATALVRHLAHDPALGLVGPVTNEIGNEAKIPVGYRRLADMPAWADAWTREHDGEAFELPMLAMFCVAIRRDTLEKVGLLDERFGVGMFEDDDYTRRLKLAGYTVRCARDAFVHHAGRASFKLLGDKRYFEIFEQNRALYQEKWGEMWEPHLDEVDRRRIPGLRARLAAITADSGVPYDKVAVFLPSIGWNTPLLQRPHHLALGLARQGWLVFFDCSGSLIDDFADFVQADKNVWLYKGPRGVLETLERPVLWALPYNVTRAARYGRSLLVYDVIDDLAVFPYNQETLRANHEQSLADADAVLCVARILLDEARRARPDALYLPNAVEYERFVEPRGDVALDPAFVDLLEAGRPVIGYYGAVASWFDANLLAAAARQRTDWSFLVIGKRLLDAPPTAELEKLPNVRFLEPKPYVELPRYLERFTAAMIPFRINDITTATSPLKMYEYFAGGKPVIATPMPECQAFDEVLIVRDAADFSRALDEARRRADDAGFRERLRALGKANSWEARVREVGQRLSEIAEPRRGAHDADLPALTAASAPAAAPELAVEPPSREAPEPFRDAKSIRGTCNICGARTAFYFTDPALYRESLTCARCKTTSRYRSIARGILRAVADIAGVQAESLQELSSKDSARRIAIYDTQQAFAYEANAYPLPELLSRCRWIDVQTSVYRPSEPFGKKLGPRMSNQNLERLTFPDSRFDIVITSDVMEHVRLEDRAHKEIRRVLKPGGVYLFTVPHFRNRETLVRVRVADPEDPSRDEHLLEPEYHGDANSEENRALAYRAFGTDLDDRLRAMGFDVDYTRDDVPALAILSTELFYCRLQDLEHAGAAGGAAATETPAEP